MIYKKCIYCGNYLTDWDKLQGSAVCMACKIHMMHEKVLKDNIELQEQIKVTEKHIIYIKSTPEGFVEKSWEHKV